MKFLIIPCLLFLLLTSCSEDKEVTYVKDEILDSKDSTVWKLFRVSQNELDVKNQKVATCSQDNLLVFHNLNQTYSIMGGVEKCDSLENTVIETGLWEVGEHQDKLYFFPTNYSAATHTNIISFSSTQLVYEVTEADGLVTEYTYQSE